MYVIKGSKYFKSTFPRAYKIIASSLDVANGNTSTE